CHRREPRPAARLRDPGEPSRSRARAGQVRSRTGDGSGRAADRRWLVRAVPGRRRPVGERMIAEPTAESSAGARVDPAARRLPELSYFFPVHDEAANLGALVAEALEALRDLADRYEVALVDD